MRKRINRKNFACWVEDTPEEIGAIDRLIASIQNQMNLTRWDATFEIFFWGFEVGTDRLKSEVEREEHKKTLTRWKLKRALDRARVDHKHIYAAVKELGTDRALEVAQEEGLDVDQVRTIIAEAKPDPEDTPWVQQAMMWLDEVLDTEPVHFEEIQRKAVEDEILPPKEHPDFGRQWRAFKAKASMFGYSKGGRRGWWEKKVQ